MQEQGAIEEWKHIHAIVRNEESGLRRIYERYLPRIRELVRGRGGSEADAQDVFQDALMILYEKARQPDFQLSSSFYSLLYGICYRLWSNRLKKTSRKEVTLSDDITYTSQHDIEDFMEADERHKLLFRALEQLGHDCRRLLELFFQGLSMKDIQLQMGFSGEAYAKKRKFQCKEKLVEMVKRDPVFAELNEPKK